MNKNILNKDIYKVAPRGPSSSKKYNDMVDTLFDAIGAMRNDINNAEAIYHKENIIRAEQDNAVVSAIMSLSSTLTGIKNTIFSKDDADSNNKAFICVGGSDYTYGPLGSTVEAITASQRATVCRYSGLLLPRHNRYISKMSAFDPIAGKSIVVDNIASVTFTDAEKVAFQSNLSYLYDSINTNKWMAITKYSTSENKTSDYIDIHLEVPSTVISSYLANYISIDLDPIRNYTVRIILNKIDGSTESYTKMPDYSRIAVYFPESQVVSADIRITNNNPNNNAYNGYDSFVFIVNNIDIAHVSTSASSILLKYRVASGNYIMSVSDVYSVDDNFDRIYNSSIQYQCYYYSPTDDNYYPINTNSIIPIGIDTVYVKVDYLDDNMTEFIDNVVIEYRLW